MNGAALKAHLVHAYTACGVAFAFLAAVEICQPVPDPRWVFVWLIAAVVVDATDGPFARKFHVKTNAPHIDGRTIDDIVDYLTFTFIPLLLVWRMGWLPEPAPLWVALAMIASLFGFANVTAKDEKAGYFLGFPSYWNIYAYYAALLTPVVNLVILLICTVLTLLPVKFVYPNLAPHPWRTPLLIGGGLWTLLLLGMLPWYPHLPGWLVLISAVYPVLYLVATAALASPTRGLDNPS